MVPVQAVYALCVFLDVCQKTAQTGAQSSCVQHRHDHGASAGDSASFLYFIKKSERQKIRDVSVLCGPLISANA